LNTFEKQFPVFKLFASLLEASALKLLMRKIRFMLKTDAITRLTKLTERYWTEL